jgi:hypothetical protein
MASAHPHQETMRPLAATVVRLIGPFHLGTAFCLQSRDWRSRGFANSRPRAPSETSNLDQHIRHRQVCAPDGAGGGGWRRGWDSNPRTGCPVNGFRDRPIRPLWHLSFEAPPAVTFQGTRNRASSTAHSRDRLGPGIDGGEGGIRTHGRVSPTHAFQACSLSHSDTSPGNSQLTKNN